jgi:hypothetical protein
MIFSQRIIRKTTEDKDKDQIFEETTWNCVHIFGIPVYCQKAVYHCNAQKNSVKKKLGLKSYEKDET